MSTGMGQMRGWFNDDCEITLKLSVEDEVTIHACNVGGLGGTTLKTNRSFALALIEGLQDLLGEETQRQSIAEAWQPIETAPKDGEKLLAYLPNLKMVEIIIWDEEDQCWTSAVEPSNALNPSHFMHILPVPEVQA
ncbi:MAG: hypothetical protein E6Q97_12625 [Desulfurellales bacterium]|nr:MAG: hypothetical protein E6Q97_12625 [Desulfurellales bacterium]